MGVNCLNVALRPNIESRAQMIRDQETFNILLDTIRRFVRERLIPAEQQVAESDEVPAAIIKQMRDMGLFGLTIPQDYGGLGLQIDVRNEPFAAEISHLGDQSLR